MKSAYELAMERLEKDDPGASQPLSESQKRALEQIEERFRAKKAERELFLADKLKAASGGGDREAVAQIRRQIKGELEQLEIDKEAEKDRIRKGD